MKKIFADISTFINTLTIQNVTTTIVNNVVKRRKELQITQKALAVLSGVSYSSLKRFEQTGDISLHSLLKIANAVHCLGDFTKVFDTPLIKDLKNE